MISAWFGRQDHYPGFPGIECGRRCVAPVGRQPCCQPRRRQEHHLPDISRRAGIISRCLVAGQR